MSAGSRHQLAALGLLAVLLVLGIDGAPSIEAQPDFSDVHATSAADGGWPAVGAQVHQMGERALQFEALYLDRDAKPLPIPVKQYTDALVRALFEYIRSIIDISMLQDRSSTRVNMRLVKMAAFAPGEVAKASQLIEPLRAQFKLADLAGLIEPRRAIEALLELLDEADAPAPDIEGRLAAMKFSGDPNERYKMGNKLLHLLDGIEQLSRNSPIGIALNYRSITVNGEPLLNELIFHIKYMQQVNLGYVLQYARKICNRILKQL